MIYNCQDVVPVHPAESLLYETSVAINYTIMRELIYFVATSLDGYIASDNGSLDGFIWEDAFGKALFNTFPETFPAHLRDSRLTRAGNKWFDAVLMGRKTYEVGVRENVTNPYPTLDQYLYSRTLRKSPDTDVELVSDHPVEFVTALKHRVGKAIWLCGGSELAATMLKADLIDRIIVKLNPVVFGSGISLFSGRTGPVRLKLEDQQSYDSGHAILYYSVLR